VQPDCRAEAWEAFGVVAASANKPGLTLPASNCKDSAVDEGHPVSHSCYSHLLPSVGNAGLAGQSNGRAEKDILVLGVKRDKTYQDN